MQLEVCAVNVIYTLSSVYANAYVRAGIYREVQSSN
jgi:hypothetical protein